MKKILLLHGNGGTTHDFAPLIETLRKNSPEPLRIETPDLYSHPSLDSLLEGDQWTLIAYSWGSYFLLRQWSHIVNKVHRVLFINPFLVQETTLSPLARWLITNSVVGPYVLKANHTKEHKAFLNRLMAPHRAAEFPFYTQLSKQLSDPELWRKAAHNKLDHFKHPLPPPHSSLVPATIFVGDQDQVCQNSIQLVYLQKQFLNQTTRHFESEGHGLIWSQINEISKEALK